MKLGNVTGKIRMENAAQQLAEGQVLLVEMEGSSVAALDCAGAKPGDRVLVVMGHAASRYTMDTPVDAVITAVVQQEG